MFNRSTPKEIDPTRTSKDLYRVFTATKVVGMLFDTLEEARKEAKAQAERYPGEDIQIWAFKHVETFRVPIGDAVSWQAGSAIDEAIKAKKAANQKIYDNPLDMFEENHGKDIGR
jgi:hypothetical protein